MHSSTYSASASQPLPKVNGTARRVRQSVAGQKRTEARGGNAKLMTEAVYSPRPIPVFFPFILCSCVIYPPCPPLAMLPCKCNTLSVSPIRLQLTVRFRSPITTAPAVSCILSAPKPKLNRPSVVPVEGFSLSCGQGEPTPLNFPQPSDIGFRPRSPVDQVVTFIMPPPSPRWFTALSKIFRENPHQNGTFEPR